MCPWGSYGFFFFFFFFFVVFLFLPFPVSPVLLFLSPIFLLLLLLFLILSPPFLLSFLHFLLLSSPSLLSFLWLLLPFFSLLLFLPWLILSPSVLQSSACSPVTLLSLITSLLSSVVSFFLACHLLLSRFFSRLPFAVYRHFLPFFPVVSSCYFFPTIASWATPTVVTCAFLSVVSFTTPVLSLVPPPTLLLSSFLLLLLLFLLSPICRL